MGKKKPFHTPHKTVSLIATLVTPATNGYHTNCNQKSIWNLLCSTQLAFIYYCFTGTYSLASCPSGISYLCIKQQQLSYSTRKLWGELLQKESYQVALCGQITIRDLIYQTTWSRTLSISTVVQASLAFRSPQGPQAPEAQTNRGLFIAQSTVGNKLLWQCNHIRMLNSLLMTDNVIVKLTPTIW